MGKLLAGMLVTLVAALTLVPSAGAAEIPPTAECVKTTKKLLKKYSSLPKNASKAASKKAEREIVLDLVEAGCISDAAPLLKKVELEPFSEACEVAAVAADNYWARTGVEIRKYDKPWRKAITPIRKRAKKLNRLIRQLRETGASPRRISAAIARRDAVRAQKSRTIKRFLKMVDPVMKSAFWDTYLTLLELSSLRCVPLDDLLFSDGEGPVRQVIEKREKVIFAVLTYWAFRPWAGKALNEGASASSAASERPKLPYIPIP